MHFESSSNIEGSNCTPCTPLTADLYLISLHRVCNNLPTNVGTQEFGYSLQIYQCHLCALVFERKCKLEDHVKRVHNEKCHSIMLDHVKKLHDKKRKSFKCDTCRSNDQLNCICLSATNEPKETKREDKEDQINSQKSVSK